MEVVLLILLLLLLLYLFKRKKSYNLPPGPPQLPFVGCLPFLNLKKGGSDYVLQPEITKHDITSIKILKTVFFLLNKYEDVKNLFEKPEFCNRFAPEMMLKHRYFNNRAQGVNNNTGENWANQRRFSLKTLKDFGFGKRSLESSMHFEIEELMDVFKAHGGADFKLSMDFNIPIINVLWQLLAGSRFSTDNPEDVSRIKLLNSIFLAGSNRQLIPYWLNIYFPSFNGFGEKCSAYEKLRNFLFSIVKKREDSFDPSDKKDFIDMYLSEIQDDPTGEKFTLEDLSACLMDFFLAGSETTSTTLKWAVLYMTIHQDVQKRCSEEIRAVIGDTEKLTVGQLINLPYLQATISEIQRVARIAGTTIPHFIVKDTRVGEYTFPKGSIFFANLAYITHDKENFENPEQFNPDRFIDSNGRYCKNEKLIPFGIGKRSCMGEILARNELFLFLGTLLQNFHFQAPENHQDPNPENYIANVTRIPDDFYVRAVNIA